MHAVFIAHSNSIKEIIYLVVPVPESIRFITSDCYKHLLDPLKEKWGFADTGTQCILSGPNHYYIRREALLFSEDELYVVVPPTAIVEVNPSYMPYLNSPKFNVLGGELVNVTQTEGPWWESLEEVVPKTLSDAESFVDARSTLATEILKEAEQKANAARAAALERASKVFGVVRPVAKRMKSPLAVEDPIHANEPLTTKKRILYSIETTVLLAIACLVARNIFLNVGSSTSQNSTCPTIVGQLAVRPNDIHNLVLHLNDEIRVSANYPIGLRVNKSRDQRLDGSSFAKDWTLSSNMNGTQQIEIVGINKDTKYMIQICHKK